MASDLHAELLYAHLITPAHDAIHEGRLDEAWELIVNSRGTEVRAALMIALAMIPCGTTRERSLAWWTDRSRPGDVEHADEWSEAPRPLVVHRA